MFDEEMKKRKIIIGLASIALIVGCGVATYEESVQIDLSSGVIRDVRKSLWMTFYLSSPKQTTISQALGGSTKPGEWLTVWEEGFSFPRTRTNPSYQRILFWVGAIDRSFNNRKVTASAAKLTLEELGNTGVRGETKDPYVLKRHLQRFWNALADDFDDSWDDSTIDIEISRIWQKTTIEQPVDSNPY